MSLDTNMLAVLFPLLFLFFGLGFTVVIDPYIRREHRSIMLIIIVLSFSLVVQNILENEFFISRSNVTKVKSFDIFDVAPVKFRQ